MHVLVALIVKNGLDPAPTGVISNCPSRLLLLGALATRSGAFDVSDRVVVAGRGLGVVSRYRRQASECWPARPTPLALIKYESISGCGSV